MALNSIETGPHQDLITRVFDDSRVKDTGTFIRGYTDSLGFSSEKQFLQFIAKKLILDVGSGYGYLAKECWLRIIPTEIISLNPRLSQERYRALEKQSTHRHPRTKEVFCTGQEIPMAQKSHDSFAVAGIAQMLPIRTGVINAVLDNNGALYYAKDQEEVIQAATEYLRVLEVGGKLRVTVPYSKIESTIEIFASLGGNITYVSQQLRVNTLAFEVVK